MIDKNFADHFANDWIAAWNSHDLARILEHYSEDFEMSSPVIKQLTDEPSGKLKGKKAVGTYWAKALALMPDLHFDLLTVLIGVDSITLYYMGARGLSAEVFFFDNNQKVIKAIAHYESRHYF